MRRSRVTLTVAVLAAVGFGLVAAGPAPGVQAVAAESSALTLPGRGPFSSLQVTVSETENLVNGVVTVSWTGAEPTPPGFTSNYLQIMQCWGDGPDGPEREQCQFGGRHNYDNQAGGGANKTTTRNVVPGSYLAGGTERDPNEPDRPGVVLGPTNNYVTVPFRSVRGESVTGDYGTQNQLFDQTTTNEVPYVRTFPDGTGKSRLEVQTAKEAPHMGCGADVNGLPRSCWLVVVPRGDRQTDGTPAGDDYLASSPLSASNWENRIVFPLRFAPQFRPCAASTGQLRVIGHPIVSEAMVQWLPGLCSSGTANVAFSDVGDLLVRRQLTTGDRPTLGILSDGLPGGGGATYAPVAVSGLALSFLVEKSYKSSVPEDQWLELSKQVTSMRLTPRLVAKLLTASYASATPYYNPAVEGNPYNVSLDPEFTNLNPEFKELDTSSLTDILVTGDVLDSYELLWRWVDGDADARAWLNGADDGFGMTVNASYQNLTLPLNDFPKRDTYCTPPGKAPGDSNPDAPPLCLLDWRPYAGSLSQAARNGSRGDNTSRNTLSAAPYVWRPGSGGGNVGTRGILVLTTTANASRYGLPSATLQTASGAFVGPTVAAMTAAAAGAAVDPDTGTLATDPRSADPAAYPLTVVSSAAVVRAKVTDDGVRGQFADIIRELATTSQQPGRGVGLLPEGYAPLPAALSAQALLAADAIAAPLPPPATTAAPVTTTQATTVQATTTRATSTTAAPPAPAPVPAAAAATPKPVATTRPAAKTTRSAAPTAPEPGLAAQPETTTAATVTSATTPVPVGVAAAAATTPSIADSPLRWVPFVALLTGAAAAITGPLLMRRGGRGSRTG